MADNKPHKAIPQAVQACHELLAWLIPQLDLFPRARRFTLGERLESGLLRVLEALVEAAYSRDKRAALATANRTLEVERHLWRLAALSIFTVMVLLSRTLRTHRNGAADQPEGAERTTQSANRR